MLYVFIYSYAVTNEEEIIASYLALNLIEKKPLIGQWNDKYPSGYYYCLTTRLVSGVW